MEEIMESCIKGGVTLIDELLEDHKQEIKKAYLAGDDDVSISINLSIREAPNQPGRLVSAGISFIESRVKASASEIIDPDQHKLPFDQKKTKPVRKYPMKKKNKS